jgi:oxygen-independent coproporphyrinogen III oxidase
MERIHHLYLHVPFCTWLCKYCDFNAYAVLERLIPAYVEGLCTELRASARTLPLGPLDTVFFGGGTPSLMPAGELQRVMDVIREVGLRPDAEVTLEANPSNVTAASTTGWLAAGVTRLSLGIQTLGPGALRFLERLHSGEEALKAIDTARASGFANISGDLLYGIPGVSSDQWLHDLDAVIAAGVQHLSAYELTVEHGTRLGQEVRSGVVRMPDAELQLEQYWAAVDRLEAAGFTHYEISNWARPRYASRHNLAGWHYRPYLGCGAGAHSLLRLDDGSSERRWNLKGPHAYIRKVTASGQALDGSERLSPARARGEAAMIGVRLLEGTNAAQAFPIERKRLVSAGLMTEQGDEVRLTRRGVELANQVGAAFLA